MKLLAMLGDLMLLTYVIGTLLMTIMNVSRTMFDPYVRGHDGYGFLARQGMIFIWPIAMFSESGIICFRLIWTGEDSHD